MSSVIQYRVEEETRTSCETVNEVVALEFEWTYIMVSTAEEGLE